MVKDRGEAKVKVTEIEMGMNLKTNQKTKPIHSSAFGLTDDVGYLLLLHHHRCCATALVFLKGTSELVGFLFFSCISGVAFNALEGEALASPSSLGVVVWTYFGSILCNGSREGSFSLEGLQRGFFCSVLQTKTVGTEVSLATVSTA